MRHGRPPKIDYKPQNKKDGAIGAAKTYNWDIPADGVTVGLTCCRVAGGRLRPPRLPVQRDRIAEA